MLNTPWFNFRIEGIGSGKIAARGHDVLRIFGERGVKLPNGNRLERAVTQIDQVNATPETLHSMSDVDAERLLEATRTVFEAFLVTWTIIERPRSPHPLSLARLSAFLEGADIPSDDANSGPRNTQFELVAGAHYILGGADIRPEEPDFSPLYHGAYVALAVKRLTSVSPDTLAGRVREAVAQIERSKGVGFVVVNLDNWITDLAGDSPDDVGKRFQQQLADAYREVARLAARKNTLLGVVILGTCVA